MNKEGFWKLIDSSRKKSEGDLEEQVDILRRQLQQLEASEIVQFDKIFRKYWARAYTWDLWGAAYIIGGGCSDDGFLDFRGWLISKGEKRILLDTLAPYRADVVVCVECLFAWYWAPDTGHAPRHRHGWWARSPAGPRPGPNGRTSS